MRVFPTRSTRGGSAEALWFLSPNGRRAIGAPGRRLPGLSIPDLEHRRAAAFFIALIERSLARPGEGLYSWLGEQQAQEGTGASVRPDGYGRYLLPDGEITFYLEIDRATEPTPRVKAKLDAYRHALAADPRRDHGNVLLVCQGPRRLANLARCAPPGPPWVWGSTDGERYTLLPGRDQQRTFCELPASPRQPGHRATDCLGRRWRPERAAGAGGVLVVKPGSGESLRAAHALRGASVSSELPPHVQIEVRRILDAAARRLLCERDAPDAIEVPCRPARGQRRSQQVAHGRDAAGLARRQRRVRLSSQR